MANTGADDGMDEPAVAATGLDAEGANDGRKELLPATGAPVLALLVGDGGYVAGFST